MSEHELSWAHAQLAEIHTQLARARERAERGERTGPADVAYWLLAEERWVRRLAQLEEHNGTHLR